MILEIMFICSLYFMYLKKKIVGFIYQINMKKVVGNAQKKYLRSRPLPAKESIKRYKQIQSTDNIGLHPVFGNWWSINIIWYQFYWILHPCKQFSFTLAIKKRVALSQWRWHVCVLNLLSFWNSMICSQNLTRSVLSILHESDYEYFTKGKIFVIVMKIFWIKVIIHLSFNKVKSFLSSWLNLLVFCSKRVQYGRTAEEWVIKCIEGI